MSTLRHALDQRRTAEAAADNPCHAVKPQVPALLVEPGDSVRWVFPWSQFLHARHESEESTEIVVLIFSSHEVTLAGRNLGPLLNAAAQLQLESIRSVPAGYRDGLADDPCIERITIAPPAPRDAAG